MSIDHNMPPILDGSQLWRLLRPVLVFTVPGLKGKVISYRKGCPVHLHRDTDCAWCKQGMGFAICYLPMATQFPVKAEDDARAAPPDLFSYARKHITPILARYEAPQ